jgi:hypothetical protein
MSASIGPLIPAKAHKRALTGAPYSHLRQVACGA